MIDLEQIKKREIEIALQVKERLEIHLDLLERVQEAILDGVNLAFESSARIDLESAKDRLLFLSVVCASRVIALVRSAIPLCCNGYALEAAVLARSLFEVSIVYEFLADNPGEAELFLEGGISTTEVVKRSIRQNKSTGGGYDGVLYGVLSEFSHHSQWALDHALKWEEDEKSFVAFDILISDPERIDPPLRQIFDQMLRFYKRFYRFVSSEFPINEDWAIQYEFILEYQDIFASKKD